MFAITTAIAMLICFFSLSSSMLTNINEQSKEIGVLRALGLKRFSLRRAYVYEAWVILITSSGALLECVLGVLRVVAFCVCCVCCVCCVSCCVVLYCVAV